MMVTVLVVGLLGSTLLPDGRRRPTRYAALFVTLCFGGSLAGFAFGQPEQRVMAATLFVLLVALVALAKPHGSLLGTGGIKGERILTNPTFLAVSVILWMLLRNLTAVGLHNQAVLGSIASLVVVGCVHVTRRHQLDADRISRLFAGFLIVSLVVGALAGDEWAPCKDGKCGLGGSLYQGIFSSENTPALFAAIGFAFALAGPRTWQRATRLLGFGVIVALTGSRTSALVIVVVWGGSWGIGAVAKRWNLHRLSLRAAFSLAAVGPVVGMWLVATSDAEALSRRGNIWEAARNATDLWSPTGTGTVQWRSLQTLGQLPDHYPHSEYLLLAVGGGLLGLILFGLMLAALLRTCRAQDPARLGYAAAPIIAFALCGLTEVVWNPTSVDFLAPLIVSVLVYDRGGPYVGTEARSFEPQSWDAA
jgi:O-antigen ligase